MFKSSQIVFKVHSFLFSGITPGWIHSYNGAYMLNPSIQECVILSRDGTLGSNSITRLDLQDRNTVLLEEMGEPSFLLSSPPIKTPWTDYIASTLMSRVLAASNM